MRAGYIELGGKSHFSGTSPWVALLLSTQYADQTWETAMAYKLGFGKHADRTLEWLFFNDPGYVWWMLDSGADAKLKGGARRRFDDLVRRAKHLRIPGACKHCRNPISRMSLTRHTSGGLAVIDFFCTTCRHDGGSLSVLTTPAFYTPDFFRSYDKTGARSMVEAIKHAYYGTKPPRMTQAKMEEFFHCPAHFVNF